MPFAIAGKILHVDLSNKKIWSEPVPDEWIDQFIGSRGINAKILWHATKPGIDPLGPKNVLIFGTGTLSGTFAPTSGRTTITCKSPSTHLYLKTNVGGHWGTELKFAGFDYLVMIKHVHVVSQLLFGNNVRIYACPIIVHCSLILSI